jgi:hypothetical protein
MKNSFLELPKINQIAVFVVGVSLSFAFAQNASASENVPHSPFGDWADVPPPGQLIVGAFYDESESYHIYANGSHRYNIDTPSGGEHYGIDINQGWLFFQYGINKQWAADLSVGYTTSGWRAFSNGGRVGSIRSTTGLMDTSLGVRYQIFNEDDTNNPSWMPTLTFRAGAVLPGTYSQNFAFAPGIRSAAIEPEFIIKKHFGWPGLGTYGDFLYRWNRTTGNDQFIGMIGLFQQIKGWELDVGYRRLQAIGGTDLIYDPGTRTLVASGSDPSGFSEVAESNDSIEAGFSYTTSKRHIKYAFYSRTVFDGDNSDQKFWVGGSIQIPFQIFDREK